jgi:hypothetical protein
MSSRETAYRLVLITTGGLLLTLGTVGQITPLTFIGNMVGAALGVWAWDSLGLTSRN